VCDILHRARLRFRIVYRFIVAGVLVMLLSGCGLKLPDQINLPTQLTGGDPQTLEAATAAAQEIADRQTSGDFAGVWQLMSKRVRDNMSETDFVTFSQICKPTGFPIKVTSVRMEGSDWAIVRMGLEGIRFGRESRTMVYEDGKWVLAPSGDFASEIGKPVNQMVAMELAAGRCSRAG